MKRPILRLVLAVVTTLACSILACATTITNYDAKFMVDQDGITTVTTQVQVSFTDNPTTMKFPIGNGSKGDIIGWNFDKMKTPEGTALEITNEDGFTGNQTFTVTYRLTAPVTNTKENQVLSLDVLPGGYDYGMETMAFAVELPGEFETAPTYVGSYHDEVADNYLDLSQTKIGFSGSALETVRDHDTLNATLNLPLEFLDYHSASGLPSWMTLGLVGILTLLAAAYWYLTLFTWPEKATRRDTPPTGVTPGDYTYLHSHQNPDLFLELCHWGAKGLLTIEVLSRRQITVHQLGDVGEGSAKLKASAFHRLFRQAPHFDGNGRLFHAMEKQYPSKTKKYWDRQTTDRNSGSILILHFLTAITWSIALLGSASVGLPQGNWRGVLLLISAIFGLFLGILAQNLPKSLKIGKMKKVVISSISFVLMIAAGNVFDGLLWIALAAFPLIFFDFITMGRNKKNLKGTQISLENRGFAKFLSSLTQEEILEKLVENDQYFYEILPYAHSLGLGNQVANLLKNQPLAPCKWLQMGSQTATTATKFYSQFRALEKQLKY